MNSSNKHVPSLTPDCDCLPFTPVSWVVMAIGCFSVNVLWDPRIALGGPSQNAHTFTEHALVSVFPAARQIAPLCLQDKRAQPWEERQWAVHPGGPGWAWSGRGRCTRLGKVGTHPPTSFSSQVPGQSGMLVLRKTSGPATAGERRYKTPGSCPASHIPPYKLLNEKSFKFIVLYNFPKV